MPLIRAVVICCYTGAHAAATLTQSCHKAGPLPRHANNTATPPANSRHTHRHAAALLIPRIRCRCHTARHMLVIRLSLSATLCLLRQATLQGPLLSYAPLYCCYSRRQLPLPAITPGNTPRYIVTLLTLHSYTLRLALPPPLRYAEIWMLDGYATRWATPP